MWTYFGNLDLGKIFNLVAASLWLVFQSQVCHGCDCWLRWHDVWHECDKVWQENFFDLPVETIEITLCDMGVTTKLLWFDWWCTILYNTVAMLQHSLICHKHWEIAIPWQLHHSPPFFLWIRTYLIYGLYKINNIYWKYY